MSIAYSSLNHRLRIPLAAEVHSRPFMRLSGPETITHFAVYAKDNGKAADEEKLSQHALLAALCGYFGVAAPASEGKYFYHDFGRFRLKWELHTEFATYTFAQHHEQPLSIVDAFDRMPLAHVPEEWLVALRGRLMVAAHVVLDRARDYISADDPVLKKIFEGKTLAASKVSKGAEVWTDFAIQADGFSRFLLRDIELREQQSGRLVQRILEIETYRMMALLGLPHAQQASGVLNDIENELAGLTATMVNADEASADAMIHETEDEQGLLRQITALAARVEKLSLENSYRFSASQAYFRLVRARIDELREIRIEGVPKVGEFMDRRLSPAMNTCASMSRRQEALAERIAHTNDLLRTRVGIVQEHQNRQILQSMNRRAAQQLRLQQAVEGLSVVAISYYVAGLINYGGKAMKAAGWPVNPDILTGLLIPVIAGCVWLGVRRIHKSMDGGHH
jgi:uncharacterized membrane-anchored protein